jgi:hypothetical protein
MLLTKVVRPFQMFGIQNYAKPNNDDNQHSSQTSAKTCIK